MSDSDSQVPPTSHPDTVDRLGVTIHYETTGHGPAVLATHGFGSSSHVWRDLAAVLAPTHQLVAWDMRGHGCSDYPDDDAEYTPAASLGDMVAVLEAVGAEHCVLLGHSLGGFLSLEFQRQHPQLVSGLVLVDTGPGYRKDEARDGWNRMAEKFASAYERKGLDALGDSGEVRADVHRDATGLARAARGILTQRDALVLEHLPSIDIPVLVIVGEHDEIYLPGSRYMASKIPGAELAVIPGAGHSPMTSTPDLFGATVQAFLSRLPA
jgi:pimeloyl-ACP methyl ester carboxylesterase